MSRSGLLGRPIIRTQGEYWAVRQGPSHNPWVLRCSLGGVVCAATAAIGATLAPQAGGFAHLARGAKDPVGSEYPIRIRLVAEQTSAPATSPAAKHEASGAIAAPAESKSTEGIPVVPMLSPVGTHGQSIESGATMHGDLSAGKANVTRLGAVRLLRLNYSIDPDERDRQALEVSKTVQVNGAEKGKAGLRILPDATISIRSRDVIALGGEGLSAADVALLERSEYMSFADLRAIGVAVRYDAAGDKLIMAYAAQ